MHTVGQMIGERRPVVALETETVREAVRRMVENRIGAVPVLSGDGKGRLVGMFTERDLLTRVVDQGLDPSTVTLADVMTRDNLVSVAPESSHEAARKLMRKASCRHVLVVADGRLVGVSGLRDCLETDLSEKTEELKMLQAYVYYIPPELSAGNA